MLVLTRKSNQSIMIGDDIEVTVLSIMGEKVRVGIQAPRDIPVFRKEVYLEIQEERAEEDADPSSDTGRRPTAARSNGDGHGSDGHGSDVRAQVDAALRKLGA